MSLTIRPWRADDAPALRPMIRACLAESFAYGADILPDEENISVLLKIGMAWASMGQPALIAVDEMPVGYILWGPATGPFRLREKKAIGLGTFVIADRRREGFSVALRKAAMRQLRELGYASLQGVTYSEAGLRSALAVGFTVTAQNIEVRV